MQKVVKFRSVVLMLMCFVGLSACGQKRDLYLPEEPTTNETSKDDQSTSSPKTSGNN